MAALTALKGANYENIQKNPTPTAPRNRVSMDRHRVHVVPEKRRDDCPRGTTKGHTNQG